MSGRIDIMVRLKQETACAHDAIEAHIDLSARLASPTNYRDWLARLYGFHVEIEPRLAALSAVARERRKLDWLVADLANLGLGPQDLSQLPRAPDAPRPTSVTEAFGVMYVLEGASLGGAVIGKQVKRTLGYDQAYGGRYFHGYGQATAAMWKRFGAALRDVSDPMTEDAIVRAAEGTFASLQAWL